MNSKRGVHVNRKRMVTLIALLLAITAGIIVLINMDRTSGPLQENDQIPNLTMEQYGQEDVSFDDFSSEVIVLNVWASWCEPCVREMPELMELNDEQDKIEVVTVNMLTKEYRTSDPVEFIEEIGLTLPVLFDTDGAFIQAVEPSRLPMTYILDSSLTIQDIIIGEVTNDLLMERIEAAIPGSTT